MDIETELSQQEKTIPPKAVISTCQWFHRHERLKSWLESPQDRVLLLSGDPGSGKSVLARFLVENLPPRSSKSETIETAVCYYFFGSPSGKIEEASDALSAFACKIPHRPNSSEHCTDEARKDGIASWKDFNELLKNSEADEIICILDAVDACSFNSLQEYVAELKECIKNKREKGTIKVLATTRPDLAVKKEFDNIDPSYYIYLSLESPAIRAELRKDVVTVIKDRLNQLNIRQRDLDQVREILQMGKCVRSPYLWVDMVFEVLTMLSRGGFEATDWKRLCGSSLQESLTLFRKLLEPASTANRSGMRMPRFRSRQHPLYPTVKEMLHSQLENLLGVPPQRPKFVWTQNQEMMCGGAALTADGPSLAAIKKELFAVWRAHDGTDQLWWAKLAAGDQGRDGTWTKPEKIHEDARTNARPSIASTENTLVALWKGSGDDEGLHYSVCRCYNNQWKWEKPTRSNFGSKTGPAVAFLEKCKIWAAWRGIEGDELLWRAAFDDDGHASGGGVDGHNDWTVQYPEYLDISTDNRPALASCCGRLYLAWTSSAPETAQQILVSTRTPGADLWDLPFSVLRHCHSSAAPSLVQFKQTVYVAWRGKGNDLGIWLTPCVGPGDLGRPELPQRLDGPATDCTPAMAEWQGELVLAWKGGWGADQRIWWGSGYFSSSDS